MNSKYNKAGFVSEVHHASQCLDKAAKLTDDEKLRRWAVTLRKLVAKLESLAVLGRAQEGVNKKSNGSDTLFRAWEDVCRRAKLFRERSDQPATAEYVRDLGYTHFRLCDGGLCLGVQPRPFGRAALCAGLFDSFGFDIEFLYASEREAVKAMHCVNYTLPQIQAPSGWLRACNGRNSWYVRDGVIEQRKGFRL